jgi:hypothetical protein
MLDAIKGLDLAQYGVGRVLRVIESAWNTNVRPPFCTYHIKSDNAIKFLCGLDAANGIDVQSHRLSLLII